MDLGNWLVEAAEKALADRAPANEAYNYRSYEADTGHYAKGTGDKLAQEYVNMLGLVK